MIRFFSINSILDISLKIFYPIFFTSILYINQAYSQTTNFTFNTGNTQNWTLYGPQNTQGTILASNFSSIAWLSETNFPNPIGADPISDSNGSVSFFCSNGTGIVDSDTWWIMQFVSPDLSSNSEWQNAEGYSVQLAENMSYPGQTTIYANLYVKVHDNDLNTDRYFYSGTAQPLTRNQWNSFSFDWSSLSNFPTNYTLLDIFIDIWGTVNGYYSGSVFLDEVKLISKPILNPPTELVTLTGYNSNVPLAWQIPDGVSITNKISKGEIFESSHKQAGIFSTTVNQSSIQPASVLSSLSTESDMLDSKSLLKPNLQSFVGYNIYRSNSLNGPFTIIANNISRQYYNDNTVINGQPYYYRVTAVYIEGESEPTSVVNAVPEQGGYEVHSKWTYTAPKIDGYIDVSEWEGATSVDITYPGATGSVTVKIMNDSVNLYIAVDDARDTHLDNLDQFAFIFDENCDRNWPSNAPSGEGFIWIYWNDSAQVSASLWGGRYGYWPYNIGLESNVIPAGVTHGISNSTGHVQYEASYNLVSSPLNANFGSKIGICMFTYDYTPQYFNALWPQQVERLKNITPNIHGWGTGPFSFGTLTLESPPNPVLTVDPSNRLVSYTSDSTTFSVISNVNWSVSDSASWLSENPTNGSGNGIFTVRYAANTTTSQRVGEITVTGGGITKQVTVTQAAAPTPEITTSVSSLQDFGNITIGQTSSPQSYIVSGSNLTGNIIITTPSGFQISLNSTSGYTNTLTLTPSLGAVANTTVYVRFSPTSVQLYSGNITHTSTVAMEKNIAVTGTGTAIPTPEITTSVSSLQDFGNVTIGQTSQSQTYTVSGSNLTDNMVITSPSGFLISLNISSGYSNSLTLTPSLGAVINTNIYVRFSPSSVQSYSGNITHTSTGATEKNVSVSGTGTAVPIPEITTSVSSLQDFGNVTVGQTSQPQTYSVSGINLTDNIVITAPTGFQISLNISSEFTNTLTLTPSLGVVTNTTIYVRFSPTSVQSYSGNITHTSTGTTEKNVTVSGTGTAVPTPEITTSVSSLQDFGNVTTGQTSQPQTYTVSGSNLKGNMVIMAPSGFQISLNSSSGYTNTLTLTQNDGTVVNTTIFVRFSPNSVESYSGNIIHICTGAAEKYVAVTGTGTAVPIPEITTSVSSLQDFGNVTIGQTSQPQTYTVSGSNLKGNMVIMAPTGFQISLNNSSGYDNTLTLTQTDGTVTSTNIFVRFTPTSIQSYSGNIIHICTGAAEKYVAVNGMGTEVPIPEITTSVSSIQDFGNVIIGQTSSPQSYTVSGINLTGDIVISAPTGFQISLNSSSGYTNSLTLTPRLGLVVNTNIYVRFSPTSVQSYSGNINHTSNGAAEKYIAVNGMGTAIPLPVITTSVSSLQDFGNVTIGQTSSPQSYTVSGINLTGNIIITAPTGFQISLNSSSGYTNSLTLTPSLGSVIKTNIYVRLSPTSVQSYSGNINHTSNGAAEKNVAISGTGTAIPIPEITTSVPSLQEFGNITVGQTSLPQNYTVSGSNLTSNIDITAPSGFQISLNSASGYTNALTLQQNDGTVTITNIYVRFIPTVRKMYSGIIKHNSIDAEQINVAVNGTGFIDYPNQIPVIASYSFPSPTEVSNYQIIGIPGDNNLPISSILKGENGSNGNWRAFWEPGNGDYIEFNGSSLFNFTPGKAFWIISRDPININESVNSVTLSENNSYSISVHNEWNLISNPFNKNIAWDNVRNANPGLSEPIYYYASGNYDTSDTFEQNKGYYFYNNPALSMKIINIPYITIDTSIKKQKFNQPEELQVLLTLKERVISKIFIDFSEYAKSGVDLLDKFSPPANFCEINLALFNAGLKTNYKYLKKEYRPLIGEGQEYEIVVKNLSNEALSLKTTGLENFSEYEVYLLEKDFMQLYDLKKQDKFVIKQNTARKEYTLYIGTKEYLNHKKTGLLPVKYRLYQNYPNPFNPKTNVRFSLPEAGKINIKVYNILGEIVKTLINNKQYNAGNYEVEFDGKSLPSGIYIIRMSAQQFVEHKKMILLK